MTDPIEECFRRVAVHLHLEPLKIRRHGPEAGRMLLPRDIVVQTLRQTHFVPDIVLAHHATGRDPSCPPRQPDVSCSVQSTG